MEVNIHQAKTHLSHLLQKVAAGEEVTVARAGVPVARLVAVEPTPKKVRPLGFARGQMWIADDFDAPLPDDLLKAFYGGKLPPLEKPPSAKAKMKCRLDSGVWLWSFDAVERISKRDLEILNNGQQEIYFSAASVWELSIKAHLGKVTLPAPPVHSRIYAKQGLRPLPVTHIHAVNVYDLPSHHRDPFDRILIAPAMIEDMTILTADRQFAKYPVDIVWYGK